MPNYNYRCDNCNHELSEYQSIKDKPKKKCPACKKHKLYRVISAVFVSVKQEPKKLGHLAARNRDNMSYNEYQERLASEPGNQKKDGWEKGDNPLYKDKAEQKKVRKIVKDANGNKDRLKKFIQTGE